MNGRWMIGLALSVAASAQPDTPKGLTVWFADGSGIEIHTESTSANAPPSTSGVETVPSGYDFHRVVFDKEGKLLFGYDIEARAADPFATVLSLKPVDTSKFDIGGNGKWLQIPTLKGVWSSTRRTGESVKMEILYNPETKEFIYDVLKVLRRREPAGAAKPALPHLSLREFRVAIDGKKVVDNPAWMVCGGMMIHLPGRGEFYLTLSPPAFPTFQPAGWIDHAILRFHSGSELVEITSKTNILQNADFATVWIHHEAEPADAEHLRRQLEEASKVYNPRHPDILQLKDRLAALDRGFEFHCNDNAESLFPKKP
jgi:hypothetical protein